MLKKIYNIVLFIMILTGLAASITELIKRTAIEADYKTVTIAIDYFQLHRFARYNGLSIDKVLDRLKQDGFDTVALIEDTPEFLEEQGIAAVVKGFNVEKKVLEGPDQRKKKEKPELTMVTEDKLAAAALGLSPNQVHVIFEPGYYRAKDLYEAWKMRLGEKNVSFLQLANDIQVVTLSGDPEELYQLGAGFVTPLLHKLNQEGFNVIPRLRNDRHLSANQITNLLNPEEIKPYLVPGTPVIFDGDEVLGFPTAMKDTRDFLKKNNLTFGFVEFAKQEGERTLGKLMLPDVIRVHSISDEEMEIYTPAKGIARFARAVKERNVRVVYLKPFFVPSPGIDLVDTNMEYFKNVRSEIEKEGFKIGYVKTFDKSQPSILIAFLIILSITAASLLVLSWGWQIRSYVLMIVLVAISLFIATKPIDSIYLKLWGMLAGVAFPSLGLAFVFMRREKLGKFSDPVSAFLIAILLTTTGGLAVAGLFSTPAYMLEMESYSGVKVSFIIPIFLGALLGVRLFFRESKSSFIRELLFLGDMEIKLKHLALLAVVAFAGLILLTRSGNEPIFSVSEIESSFRGMLEGFFSVRPRTKEFLIGHPLLILAFYTLWRYPRKLDSLAFICLVGGMIGQVSVFNTFCHFHTPLDISILRTIYGLVAGAIGGLILVILLSIIMRFWSKPDQN